MKIRKTRQDERGVYRYPVQVPDGRGGYRREYVTIRPGEDGVTEADIRILHSLDDREVYSNLKNLRPERTPAEREAVAAWCREWAADFEERYGYEPGRELVAQAAEDAFPKNWNLSLDCLGEDGGDWPEKSRVLERACVWPVERDPEAERLYEVMESLTERQRRAFKLVKLEGYTLTAAARLMDISVPGVKRLVDRAVEKVKKIF